MRRAKTEVLQHFEAGLREADVPGTGWATAAEAAAAEADVDALIADAMQRRARAQSVSLCLTRAAPLQCAGALELSGMLALLAPEVGAVDGHLARARVQPSSRPGGRAQVAEVTASAEKALTRALTGPAIALLESCPDDLWPRLARLLAAALRSALQVASPAEEHACASVLASGTGRVQACRPWACARACSPGSCQVCSGTWESQGGRE